jgi:hypothetical protein
MANGEWRIGGGIERSGDQLLPGSACMAGSDVARGIRLRPHARLSSRGAVRHDGAGEACFCICASQHRGGSRTRAYEKLHPIPSHRPRIAERARNTHAACARSRYRGGRQSGAFDPTLRISGENAAFAYPLSATTRLNALTGAAHSPFAIRHSRSAYSLFAIRYSRDGGAVA